jgi:sugar phosphate isomerase/epimerase
MPVSNASHFAVSTSLFERARLDREHLVEIAAHGFDGIELAALGSHVDVTDAAAVAQLAEWLDDTRLRLTAVHAPVADGLVDGVWQGPLSLAARDAAERTRALDATRAVLTLARAIPFTTLIVPVGLPAHVGSVDESAEAARASVETLAAAASAHGVRLAVRLQANRWSSPDALVSLVEALDDAPPVGICIDVGQARLGGDPVDAIEIAAEHITAARLTDTRGRRPDPLVPYDGATDWDAVLLAFQKVGYCGPWTLELPVSDTPPATLTSAAHARRRLEDSLGLTDLPYTS